MTHKPVRVLRVSNTQIKLAKQCPRKWHLRYGLGLKPLAVEEREEFFRKGDVIHQALEIFHASGDLEAAQAKIRDVLRVLDAFDFGGGTEVSFTAPGEQAWAMGFFNAYVAYERVRRDLDIGAGVDTEREFPKTDEETERLTLGFIDLPDETVQVVLGGKWDGYKDGRVVEHKTVATLSHVTPEDLVLDEQVSAMCWAASRLHDRPVLEVSYNLLCKPQIKFQPQNQKALRNEDEHSYARRVFNHCLSAPGKFFERMTVTRTADALLHWQQEVVRLFRFLLTNDVYQVWGVNQGSWSGPCRNCPFHDLCAVWGTPSMRERAMHAGFTTKAERDEKEAEGGEGDK